MTKRNHKGHIRWGIIGCGDVTEVKSGPAFSTVPNSSLVAVMRRDEAKARDYALRHKVPRWYANADSLINDPEVDAVYVATPPDSHADYALRTLEAGKPVYVEKPMAHAYRECLAMAEKAENSKLPLYIAYYRRALPYFLKVKELIESGDVGDIRAFTIMLMLPPRPEDYRRDQLPWRLQQKIAGAGYFYDLASHQLDLVDFLLGPVSTASGITGNQAGLYDVEDTVAAIMELASGVQGTGQWVFTTHASAKTDTFTIVGSQGKIVFSSFDFTPIELINDRGTTKFDIKPPTTIQQPFIQKMVSELLDDAFFPGNYRDAARCSRVMDIILNRPDAL